MKPILLVFACLLAASAAVAQENCRMARTGVYTAADGSTVVAEPSTTLAVDLTLRCDRVLSGPYARYAQKYLGLLAPLTDKSVWTLVGGKVAVSDDPDAFVRAGEIPSSEQFVVSHARAGEEFARLQPDKLSTEVLPLEEAARKAASTLFALRRHRLELITGEAGEHVFGAGLGAALDEIARIEQSYLELFLGRRTVETRTVRLSVEPEEGQEQYIVCRFTAAEGVVPADDLSGDPVVLGILPTGRADSPWESQRGVAYRVAMPAECTLSYGGGLMDRRVLPIFEMGRTVLVEQPKSDR